MNLQPLAWLDHARDAYSRRAWADAFEQLRQADQLEPLGADDLVRLAWCAGMLDRDDTFFATCERLVGVFGDAGRHDHAAYWAFIHAFRLFAIAEPGHAAAWLHKARQHVEHWQRECAASGWLLLPAVMRDNLGGAFEQAAANAQQALAIGERCGDAELVAFAQCTAGRALTRLARIDEGLALLDRAMLAATAGELSPVFTGLVYCHVIGSCRQVFAFDRSREWTAALSDWCDAQPHLVSFNGLCMLHRAEILELNGDWQQSLAEATRAQQPHERNAYAETEAAAHYQAAQIHRLRGEFAAAERGYEAASRLGRDPQPGLALLRLAQGRAHTAAAGLRRALAASDEPLNRSWLLPAAIECWIADGALDAARQACDELARTAARFATAALHAGADEARARIDIADGDAAAALPHLRRALAVWQRSGAPYLEARVRMLAAQACRMLGDDDGARLELDAACAVFERLGARPDLQQAGAAPGDRATSGLSRRELQVLALVATGRTNKAIASELALSEKTIGRHVSNIFDKLGVDTRTAAAAFGFQHGLL